MLIDKQLQFSEAQVLTTTAPSTNVIDTGAARDIGPGENVEVFMNVDEAALAAGAATVDFDLQTSVDSAFTAPISVSKVSGIGKASIVQGYNPFKGFILPTGIKRYLRIVYTVNTGPLTAGKVSSGLILASDQWTALPNGI